MSTENQTTKITDAIVAKQAIDLSDKPKEEVAANSGTVDAPEKRTMEKGFFPHFEEETRVADTARMEGGFPPHLRRGPTRPKPRGLREAVGDGPKTDTMFEIAATDASGKPTELYIRKHAQVGVALHVKQAIERTLDRYDIYVPSETRNAIYELLHDALKDGACRYINGSYNCLIIKEEERGQ